MIEKIENTRGAMPLDLLVQFWEKHLGEDDPLNPPNLLGEVIQDTIHYLKEILSLSDGELLSPEDNPYTNPTDRVICFECVNPPPYDIFMEGAKAQQVHDRIHEAKAVEADRERIFKEIEDTFPFISTGVNAKPWGALKGG